MASSASVRAPELSAVPKAEWIVERRTFLALGAGIGCAVTGTYLLFDSARAEALASAIERGAGFAVFLLLIALAMFFLEWRFGRTRWTGVLQGSELAVYVSGKLSHVVPANRVAATRVRPVSYAPPWLFAPVALLILGAVVVFTDGWRGRMAALCETAFAWATVIPAMTASLLPCLVVGTAPPRPDGYRLLAVRRTDVERLRQAGAATSLRERERRGKTP